jgi:DNA repair protein RadC
MHITTRPDKSFPSFLIHELPPADRPAVRLRRHGPGILTSAELLAVLLGTADGLALAQGLVLRFGGLTGLAQAELHGAGLAPTKTLQLKAALALGQRLIEELQETGGRSVITSPAQIADLLLPEMALLEQECLRVIVLDTRYHVLAVEDVYRGNIGAAVVRPAEVLRLAVRANAPAIAIAHNHPGGDPTPSPEDVQCTRAIYQAGQLLGIDLIDHIVVASAGWISLKTRGLGF